ncbi:HEAT-SHOCK PROTEIN 20 FAMILY MEMBER, partial [Salix viminalis]
GFPFVTNVSNVPSTSNETQAIVNTRWTGKRPREAHIFKIDLPGLKKEESESRGSGWVTGKFLKRCRLPDNAKVDQIKATMENGVLTVIVPKEEEKKPEVKAIN